MNYSFKGLIHRWKSVYKSLNLSLEVFGNPSWKSMETHLNQLEIGNLVYKKFNTYSGISPYSFNIRQVYILPT